MSAGSCERIFQAERDLPTLTGVFDACVFVLIADPDPTVSGRDREIKHLSAGNPLRLDAIRRQPRVSSVAIHPGGPLDPLMALALAFGEHLTSQRSRSSAPIVSLARDTGSLTVDRTPFVHFATVETGCELTDHVVWEWVTPREASGGFTRPLPEVPWIEEHLAELVALRRVLREHGRINELSRLRDALDGRCLSGPFVLQHHQLVAAALAELSLRQEYAR